MIEKEKPQLLSNNEQKDGTKPAMDFRFLSALVRTAFSAEQSLMSWMRTSLSLFTFGFSITQFFNFLEEQGDTSLSIGPRRLGLVLIFVGILALGLALVEHVQRLRRMKKQGLPNISQYFLPVYSAVLLLAIGCAALIGTFFKWSL
jgi:putative membrane protein